MAGISPKHPVIWLYHSEALFQAGQEAKQFYLVRRGCILDWTRQVPAAVLSLPAATFWESPRFWPAATGR